MTQSNSENLRQEKDPMSYRVASNIAKTILRQIGM